MSPNEGEIAARNFPRKVEKEPHPKVDVFPLTIVAGFR
jgi:hypothetical protein